MGFARFLLPLVYASRQVGVVSHEAREVPGDDGCLPFGKLRKASRGQQELTWRAIEQVQQLAALFTKRRGQLAGRVGITVAQWRMLEGIATEHFMPSLFAREQDNTPTGVNDKLLENMRIYLERVE